MPGTSLKAVEWEKIGDIMQFILSGDSAATAEGGKPSEDIWSLYFSQFQAQLLTSQVYAIQLLENELYGSEELRLLVEA